MEVSRGVNTFVCHPIWDKTQTKGGILTGANIYKNLPPQYYPTSAIVIDAPKKYDIQKGDKIHFVWSAWDYYDCEFKNLIDKEKNIAVFQDYEIFAYEREGIITCIKDCLLLERVEEKEEEKVTESGIVLGGFMVSGMNVETAEIVEKTTIKKLHGKIVSLPEKMAFEKMLNPFTREAENIKVGKNCVIEDGSEVKVTINDKVYYRTTMYELMYIYD